ncbi:hypothetical protein HYH03_016503 [Edaphochlamys debaryana]|uniref:Uncharacterized protein n=1 Tax=Edaphochlamys debaryana TaxID=47281 RepID=A0A836BRC8_9CHLO|nr:hypothetical protein HYH03_016503 [Edaphochlamys debaryana]|eukprot:KAG2484674.1 hypothetical protein HYH03_016503 [Edaphochlamys debaryana]
MYGRAADTLKVLFKNTNSYADWNNLADALNLGCDSYLSLEVVINGQYYNQDKSITDPGVITNKGARYLCPRDKLFVPHDVDPIPGFMRPGQTSAGAAYERRLCSGASGEAQCGLSLARSTCASPPPPPPPIAPVSDCAESKLCSQFWNAGGLSKWPRCCSVTLVWDAAEVRHGEVDGPLLLPFARAPLEARQRVRELTVSAQFYGEVYFTDAESSESASGDEDDNEEEEGGEEEKEQEEGSDGAEAEGEDGEAEEGEEAEGGEGLDAKEVEAGEEELKAKGAGETMQLPAKPLAALLRLLPNLHTVHLPPSSPYKDSSDGALVCSALARLPNLHDLTISSITLAEQLRPLRRLQHLTRLVVGSLDPTYDLEVTGEDDHWEDDMEDPGVEAICALKGLKRLELRLWNVMQVWDTMIADMVDALPRLEHVSVRGPSAAEWYDSSGSHGFLGRFNTLSFALASGRITAIDIESKCCHESVSSYEKVVSLGLLAHFCKTMLLPCVAPAPAPPIERLRLRCSVALSDTDAAGEWAAPLRELVGRCAAVEVEAMDCSWEAAGRRVAAAEVEALVRLLGVPERVCLGRHMAREQSCWVQLRRPGEPRALGCGGGGGAGAPAPPSGGDVAEGALKHLRYDQLARALQALWDDGAAGTELQRLRRLLTAVTEPPRTEPAPQYLAFMPEYW